MILKTGRPSTHKDKCLIKISNKNECTNMTLNVTKDFHKQVKMAALEEDTTIKDIIIKSVKLYLNK